MRETKTKKMSVAASQKPAYSQVYQRFRRWESHGPVRERGDVMNTDVATASSPKKPTALAAKKIAAAEARKIEVANTNTENPL